MKNIFKILLYKASWKFFYIYFSVFRNYVIPSRLNENQLHSQHNNNHLSGFTAIQELAELDESLEAAGASAGSDLPDSRNSSRNNSPDNDYYGHEGNGSEAAHSSADFYEMEAYNTGDAQGEKREGGAMVPILPWKGVRKNSTASSKVTLSD